MGSPPSARRASDVSEDVLNNILDEEPVVIIDDWVPNPAWMLEDNVHGLTTKDWENEVNQFVALCARSGDVVQLE